MRNSCHSLRYTSWGKVPEEKVRIAWGESLSLCNRPQVQKQDLIVAGKYIESQTQGLSLRLNIATGSATGELTRRLGLHPISSTDSAVAVCKWRVRVVIFMWVEVRWCRGAWGKRIGQSCWRECSCSRPLREAPDTPQPAAAGRGCGGGKPLVGHDIGTASLGTN